MKIYFYLLPNHFCIIFQQNININEYICLINLRLGFHPYRIMKTVLTSNDKLCLKFDLVFFWEMSMKIDINLESLFHLEAKMLDPRK